MTRVESMEIAAVKGRSLWDDARRWIDRALANFRDYRDRLGLARDAISPIDQRAEHIEKTSLGHLHRRPPSPHDVAHRSAMSRAFRVPRRLL